MQLNGLILQICYSTVHNLLFNKLTLHRTKIRNNFLQLKEELFTQLNIG
jgi:hypothetical protein